MHMTSQQKRKQVSFCPCNNGSVRLGWLGFFLAAVGGVSQAQEQKLLDYWWVMPREEVQNAPRVIRVIGAKGERFEEVHSAEQDAALRSSAAIMHARLERQAALRLEARNRARELREAGKPVAVAYEEAWAEVYSRRWLNADWRVGSSKLEDMLTRMASADEDLQLTEEEIQWVLEALLEDDDRLEGEAGRELLRNLARRLRSMGYGRINVAAGVNDELMERFAESLRHGKESMAAYRDAMFKTFRDRVMHHALCGYRAPWGMGAGGTKTYRQAPITLTTTAGTGNTPQQPIQLTTLTASPHYTAPGLNGTPAATTDFLAKAPVLPADSRTEEETEEDATGEDEAEKLTLPPAPPMLLRSFSLRSVGAVALAAEDPVAQADDSVLTVSDAAALYFKNDGLTTSGNTQIRRSGRYGNYTYTVSNPGSYNGTISWTNRRTSNTYYWQGSSNLSSFTSNVASAPGGLVGEYNRIVLEEGAELYIGGSDYKGTIEIQGGDTVIGSYDTTAGTTILGNLTGSGDLLLRGHNTSGTSTFEFTGTDTEDWFDGTLYMTANGGSVVLNISDERWQNTEVNLTRKADFSVSKLNSTGSEPAGISLQLKGDAAVKGLEAGDASTTVTGSYALTLGSDENADYSCSGTLGENLQLVKVGSNTQSFTQAAALDAVQVQAGVLVFADALTTTTLSLEAGALRTDGDVTADELKLYGGASWALGRSVTMGDAAISVLNLQNGAITLGSANGSDWNLAGASIDMSAVAAQFGNQAIFTLDGADLDTGSSLTFTGLGDSIRVGGEYVLATSASGWSGSSYADTVVELQTENAAYTGALTLNARNELVIRVDSVVIPSLEVAAGERLWIHRFESADGHQDGELEGLRNATFVSANPLSWRGTAENDQLKLNNIILNPGAEVYIRDGEGTRFPDGFTLQRYDFQYDGRITVSPGASAAAINAECSWVDMVFNGELEGSGVLKFVTHCSADYSTVFNFVAPERVGADWFSGTVQLRAPRGGRVQLNIGQPVSGTGVDTRWDNVVFDLTNTADTTSVYDNRTYTANDMVLGIVGDARILGIKGSSSSAGLVPDGGEHTLILGTDGESYSFAGRVGSGRFYNGGQYNSTAEGGTPASNIAGYALSITKVGSNTQTFTGSVSLDTLRVENGTLALTGSSGVKTLELLAGGTLQTAGLEVLSSITLQGGAAWNMTSAFDASENLIYVENLAGGQSVNLGGSGWTTAAALDFSESGLVAYDSHPAFTLRSSVNFTVGDKLNILGVSDSLGTGSVISLYGGKSLWTGYAGKEVIITTMAQNSYTGEYFVDSAGNLSVRLLSATDTPGADPVSDGYIWSGEADNTGGRYTDECFSLGMVLGRVWRADGSADNTGWHEQSIPGASRGVYVNGQTAIFADTDVHGEAVTDDARDVILRGQVAPGSILVRAEQNAAVSGTEEATIYYGYAFTTAAGQSGSIIDVSPEHRTKITKSGDALLILNTLNSFSGGVEVQDGGLYLGTEGAAGSGTLVFHTDRDWNLKIADGAGGSASTTEAFHGGVLMVSYLHSDQDENNNVSAYRSGTVANDIVLKSYEDGEDNQFTISFGRAAYNVRPGSNNHFNVPRHWRTLTLSGAMVGTGSREDTLVLEGYSSTWANFRDQSYVTVFRFNEHTAGSAYTDNAANRFSGTIKLENAINTSPLDSNKTENRTAGTTQVRLEGDKFIHAHLDMSRQVEDMSAYDGAGATPRQTYNNILVVDGGQASLRGLSADFRGSGYYYNPTGDSDDVEERRSYLSSMAQNDEVWHVRTVASSYGTLNLGESGDTATYVYSGAMGFDQTYTLIGQGHVSWGDGFDQSTDPGSSTASAVIANPTSTGQNEQFNAAYNGGAPTTGVEALSVVKRGGSSQYIHTAKLNDVSLFAGTLGFNNLELTGNMNLVGGTHLELGVTGQVDDNNNWKEITATTSSLLSADGESYRVNQTSREVRVEAGKTLTVYTPKVEVSADIQTAWVEGDLTLAENAALTFVVNGVVPSTQKTPVLLDVDGTLAILNNTGITINFEGVNFSTTEFENHTYYLAAANEITVGGEDSREFTDRIISLGYGYFGILDTLDDSGGDHPSGDSRDYLVMQVAGDPRHTWAGRTDLNGVNYTWTAAVSADTDFDYRWKENTVFRQGDIVLFGNLYVPTEWEDDKTLSSSQSVRVSTELAPGTRVEQGETAVLADGSQQQLWVDDLTGSAAGYQKVRIEGEVAPLAVVINSDYLQNENGDGKTYAYRDDSTHYFFYGSGTIRDASPDELLNKPYTTQGEWQTTVQKMGYGTAVIATDNSYSGGTLLQGGRIVMQHANALGRGGVTIVNAHTGQGGQYAPALQGDFTDDRSAPDWVERIGSGNSGAYTGEAMSTATIINPVTVNAYVNPDNPDYNALVDGRVANAHDHKLVLKTLTGESDTVLVLEGHSVDASAAGIYAAQGQNVDLNRYTYAVFKVLDPSRFLGTIQMDGNVWGVTDENARGGKVQLEMMTTVKSDNGADWLNSSLDLSIKFGTERTVLALDAEVGNGAADVQTAQVNVLQGGGNYGAFINSSVLNMSESKTVTLEIEGMKNGDYDGALGYGAFQRTTDYGDSSEHASVPVGYEDYHLGCEGHGSLNVLKKGNATTQSVYSAWLNELTVEGGVFSVDKDLVVRSISSGAGKRVFIGSVADDTSVYALTVGAGGILAMDNGSLQQNSLAGIKAGITTDNQGFVNLLDGATLSAQSDWFTDTPLDIANGAHVTVNTHEYTPTDYINEGNDMLGSYEHSHIIQLLGRMSGHGVNLEFNNEQISAGAAVFQDTVDLSYTGSTGAQMGYAALKDIHQVTGDISVEDMTVLQVRDSNAAAMDSTANIDAFINGDNAAMQFVDGVTDQYINRVQLERGGHILLGGEMQSSLENAESASGRLESLNLNQVELDITNRYMAGADGASAENVTGSLDNLDLVKNESARSMRVGGTVADRTDAANVRISTLATQENYQNLELHDVNLNSSIVQLHEECSLNLAEAVLVDANSAVVGSQGHDPLRASQQFQVAQRVQGLGEVLASASVADASETTTVGLQTTVMLTTADTRTVYTSENGNEVLHVYANQFQDVNVTGSGLTLVLADDLYAQAYRLGMEFIAIEVGGETGRFLFEETNPGAIVDGVLGDGENFVLTDTSGRQLSDEWVVSSTVSSVVGAKVSTHMLWIRVPEPATSTLGLLALTTLAARRRRRS